MNTELSFVRQAKPNGTCPPLITTVSEFRREEWAANPSATAISVANVRIRHLKTIADIKEVQSLRDEINLELHRTIDSNFAEHEKKEMS